MKRGTIMSHKGNRGARLFFFKKKKIITPSVAVIEIAVWIRSFKILGLTIVF